MVIQENLIERVEAYVDTLRQQKKYENYLFKVRKSKTTMSLYVQIFSRINGEMIRLTYRFSDHKNSKVKTKVLTKNTSFTFIERKIKAMLKSMQRIRYEKWSEAEARKRVNKL